MSEAKDPRWKKPFNELTPTCQWLAVLVMHDDSTREYTDGPAQRLPDTKIGAFPQVLYDEAKKNGWVVISMKNDWTRILSLNPKSLILL